MWLMESGGREFYELRLMLRFYIQGNAKVNPEVELL